MKKREISLEKVLLKDCSAKCTGCYQVQRSELIFDHDGRDSLIVLETIQDTIRKMSTIVLRTKKSVSIGSTVCMTNWSNHIENGKLTKSSV